MSKAAIIGGNFLGVIPAAVASRDPMALPFKNQIAAETPGPTTSAVLDALPVDPGLHGNRGDGAELTSSTGAMQ